MTDPKDDMLDDLFAEARSVSPEPSDALVARVLADAARPSVIAPGNKPGLLDRLLDMIGGWPAAGGLVAATLSGLWLGIAPPASVEDFTAVLLGDQVAVGILSEDIAFDMGAFVDG
ncbi:MAG: hypothetical protein AAF801_03525 [Pseudomonadota bacterium]